MAGWGGLRAHLTVAGDGTASGRLLEDDLSFMTARSHVPPPLPPLVRGVGDVRETRIDPSILDDQAALWAAQLAVPQAQCVWGEDGTTFLIEVGSGSSAVIQPQSTGGWTAHQHGPAKLWDAIEDAILRWQEAGRPHQSCFGLTVTPKRQWVWLGDPDGPSWNLPT
ncbi:hypothetical protein [Nonomuraea glycinis]|uniref:hypothetical protein n=1 Tax=Nonomuraea glycinis TaxID=2047744 RepID=UPI002E0FE551|nr:hypothetical protein OHA68_23340 [Nonomuraea glycinis]